jgi:two-component system LytT family response regulator
MAADPGGRGLDASPGSALDRPIRTVVVDDEDAARRHLVDLLRYEPDVRVVGECRDGVEALNAITRDTPDLVFLDVTMPELDGPGVVEALDPASCPVVVFVTAYSRYYERAFELRAIDYLRKPFSEVRFTAALDHARQRVRERRLASSRTSDPPIVEHMRDVVAAREAPSAIPRRIPVYDRTDGSWYLLPPDGIEYVSADPDRGVQVHTARLAHPVNRSIARLERDLAPCGFLRVHRQYLVNAAQVVRARLLYKGQYLLTFGSGATIETGRAFQDVVRHLLR